LSENAVKVLEGQDSAEVLKDAVKKGLGKAKAFA
jgi:hypothetical protein